MRSITPAAMHTYDAFAGEGLDPSRWTLLEVPLRNGSRMVCREPEARLTVADGTLEVRVDEFRRAGDPALPITDNPKHLCYSTRAFPIAPDRPTRFGVEMAAENRGGNPLDYRDGFVAFLVAAHAHAMVFNHIATGQRLHILYERLSIPRAFAQEAGAVEQADGFTYVVDSPMVDVRAAPG